MTVGLPQQCTCGTMSVHYRLLTTDLTYSNSKFRTSLRHFSRSRLLK